jgi:hypothetical protein
MKNKSGKRSDQREIQETRNGFVKMPKQVGSQGDIITKRVTYSNSYATSSGGVLALDVVNCAQVQSNPASEWASFAARYQQFRVKALSVTFYMVYPSVGPYVFCDYIGSAAPSSATQIVSDERCVIRAPGGNAGSTLLVYETDWSRNPNARLWNPTSAALPAANGYGIAFTFHPLAVTVDSLTVLVGSTDWLVEFRGSQ